MSSDTQRATTQTPQVLVAGTLYAPEEVPGPVAVVLEGAKIRAIWRATDAAAARSRIATQWPGAAVDVIDLGSWRLAPGYIDLHIHGFQGHDVTTGSQEDIEAMARELPQTGVTSFFPTIATTGRTETAQQVRRVIGAAENQANVPAATILGIRLEGPFISRAKKGAQYEPGIRPPDPAEIMELAAIAHGWIRIVDYAPEEDVESRFLATIVRLGILPCIGHTAATYEQAIRAIDGGVRHSTHLFNAMSELTHREPGTPGALLTDHRATVEVIADGIHIHPAVLKLVIAARGPEAVALVTDAVAPAGLPDGDYEFIGRQIIVCEGAVRLSSGALAGSTLTLDRAVRNIATFAGLGWSEAIRMATLTPARIAGVAARLGHMPGEQNPPQKGQIVPGADADLLALDERGFVQRTWIQGRLVYQSAPDSNKEE
jgi:N-acetylglucosamine-6-phosphate deacetylase